MSYTISKQDGSITGIVVLDEVNLNGAVVPSENVLGHVQISEIFEPQIPSNYGLITWNGSYLTVS